MIFCRAIELKSSKPTLAQDRLISRSSYTKCSNSACFFLSRSRVESKNESMSSCSRASSFSCSPRRGRYAWGGFHTHASHHSKEEAPAFPVKGGRHGGAAHLLSGAGARSSRHPLPMITGWGEVTSSVP